MRNITIEHAGYVPASKRDVEIVERKGKGHPDSLIDGIVEEISRELCRYYLNEFGAVLHHNVDKGQVCAGEAKVDFGGGMMLKPIYILLSGRATEKVDGKTIPVQHIAIKTAKEYLKKTLPNLDVEHDVIVDSRIAAGSPDLVNLFTRSDVIPLSNDTSFGTGYAPLSQLERTVFAIEQFLNNPEYKAKYPAVGEDIKVMGMREGDRIKITVACAFISKYIHSLDEYINIKEKVLDDAKKVGEKSAGSEIEVCVNSADDEKNGSVYLTLTGTSAEMGDDGSVGRGNRVNGLITPMRSMTLEAAAGKNPINHVGKIYSLLAFDIANTIVKEYGEIEDVTITLLSQIGKPIDQPKVASVQVICEKNTFIKLKDKIQYIVDGKLENIREITKRIIDGELSVF
jgi:S-adenosylmethionine synthetase